MTKINLEQRIGNWYMINPIKCDELIARGQTSTYIARQFGVSHVAVLKYINRTNQYQSWVRKRKRIIAKEIKEKTALQEELDQQKRLEKERLLAERKKQEEQLESKVLEAIRDNLTTSPEALSEYTSIKSKKIKKILSRYEISRRKHHSQTIPIIVSADINVDQVILDTDSQKQKYAILEAVQKDKPVAIEQVRRKTGIEKETIEKVLREERLLLDLPSRDYRPEIDQLIADGFTALEIARRLRSTPTNIRQYAKATVQQLASVVEKKKTAKAALLTAQKSHLDTLIERQYQQVEKEYDRYASGALDYFYNQRRRDSRKVKLLGKLLSLAKTYAEAEDKGERLSYQELGDRCELHFVRTGQLLSRIGLRSMHWNIESRTKVTPSQKEAIKNSYFTSFSAPDLGYFLDLPAHLIAQHFTALKKIRGRRGQVKICLQGSNTFGSGPYGGDFLNYRRASQVYELDDCAQRESASFTPEELGEGIGINPKLVVYARENRPVIEREIKRLLTILFPGEEPNKPYRKTKS